MNGSPDPVELVDVLPTPFGGLLLVVNGRGSVELYTVSPDARSRRPEPPQGWDAVATQVTPARIPYAVVAHVEVTDAGDVREVGAYPPLVRLDGRSVGAIRALHMFREVVYPLVAAHITRHRTGGTTHMATTDVPAFDGPLDPDVTLETVRVTAREWLVEAQGDCDKASDPDDNAYYQGHVDALTGLLHLLTGTEPED